MCKKMWAGRRKKVLQERSLEHPRMKGRRLGLAVACNLTDYGLLPLQPSFISIFCFFLFIFWYYKEVWG
jgi:hypothetical protein